MLITSDTNVWWEKIQEFGNLVGDTLANNFQIT